MRARSTSTALCAWLATLSGVALGRGPALLSEATEQADPTVAVRARKLLDEHHAKEAAELLADRLSHSAGTGLERSLYGRALVELGRRDEAAHELELALAALAGDARESRVAQDWLARADPLASKRAALFKRASRSLLESAQKLKSSGDVARAIDWVERAIPLATAPELETLRALDLELRASSTEVRLDRASKATSAPKVWPLYESRSAHYKLACNLEPAVADQLGQVMDDVWNDYVQIYFDGDASKAASQPATIRIYESREVMAAHWNGEKPIPLGWWSPGEWQVTSYDTTSDDGSLDKLLEILFHEASHEFTSLLAGSAPVPAWINEGTASFFEGATAMSDHKVLWPDVATERMHELAAVRAQGKPTVADVLAWSEPRSYPPEYYSVGWALVYFLQQYEDPASLEYVYRPLFARYRREALQTNADPRKLFEAVFLGPKSPGKFASLDEFVAAWNAWLDARVFALFQGERSKPARLELAKRYIAAADQAKSKKLAAPGEHELLTRALGMLDYVRRKLDATVDPNVLELQADVFDRLGRTQAGAKTIETLLDAVDSGSATLEAKRYDALEKRLAQFDAKNASLRNARGRSRALALDAAKLLAEYEAQKFVLQSYTLARLASTAFGAPPELAAHAARLHDAALSARLLRGAVLPVTGALQTWTTIHSTPGTLAIDDHALSIEGVRPFGKICTAVAVRGEYEVRARISREGELHRSAMWGLVFSGLPATDWLVFGVNGDGSGFVKWLATTNGGSPVENLVALPRAFAPPIGDERELELAVHVFPGADAHASVRVGAREPIEVALPRAVPAEGFVGLYVKDGRLSAHDFVVEQLP